MGWEQILREDGARIREFHSFPELVALYQSEEYLLDSETLVRLKYSDTTKQGKVSFKHGYCFGLS